MPHYPVRQPNGKLAIYSTIVNSFTMYDCEIVDAVNEIINWHKDTDPPTIYGKVADIAAGRDPKQVSKWWGDWEQCLSVTAWRHGWEDEVVVDLMNMTSIEGRKRIRDAVAKYQAEQED